VLDRLTHHVPEIVVVQVFEHLLPVDTLATTALLSLLLAVPGARKQLGAD
jgi:hypothetical protein